DTGDSLVISMNKVLKNTDKKLKSLIDLIDNIRDSEMVNAVVNLTTKNGGDLGEFLACPVEVKTDKVYGIENYGSAMAPFYSTLAIWVGAIMLVALVKTNVKKKKEISPLLKPHEEFFGRSLLFLCIAIVQGLIICLGDLYFLKIQCYHPVKFLFAGVLASIVYSFFIYSIVYTFGDIGKAIGVIMLVVQIGGSGGTFPIDVTPRFFVSINPYIPFTFVIEAMRECICGTYGNDYWIDLLKLLAYAVAGLIIGLPVKAIVKKPVKFFEKKIEETGLF
ncbi:YhgE/Pip family protein, partial [Eubacterium coprostanoligenes]